MPPATGLCCSTFMKIKGCIPSEWRKQKMRRKNVDRQLSDKNICSKAAGGL